MRGVMSPKPTVVIVVIAQYTPTGMLLKPWNMQELMISIMETTGTTVVMVTHDIEEALFLGDRITFISRHPGTVLEDMTTDFKGGERVRRKEDVLTVPGYAEMERHIMKLMREQGAEEEQEI